MPDWLIWTFLGVALAGFVAAITRLAAATSRVGMRHLNSRRHPCRTCLGSGLLVSPGGHLRYCPTCNPRKEP